MSDFRFILASTSQTRAKLLHNVGLKPEIIAPRVDEESVKHALLAENLPPRDIADALAEAKAAKIAAKNPDAWVLGGDQVLDFDGQLMSKPENADEAIAQLSKLSGNRHRLLSALVLYHENRPVWRHIGQATLTMRQLSDAYISTYVSRNWQSVQYSVGAYKLEEEGARLFTEVRGDYFTILGLPLLPLLSHLALHGLIET